MKKSISKDGVLTILIIITIILLTVVAIAILFKSHHEIKANFNNKISSEDIILETDNLNPKWQYKIGDIVNVGEEEFYVLKNSSKKDKQITLLAKKCIDITTLSQDEEYTRVQFAENNYWSNADSYNLISQEEPDISYYALRAAYEYGEKIGGKGRLLTFYEANELKDVYEEMIYGTEKKDTFLIYWLGTANDKNNVWRVYGHSGYLNFSNYKFQTFTGVRPVIEISKSKITPANIEE